MKTDPERFILENTSVLSPPHVPEIRLHLASEVHDLWLKTEEDLEDIGLPPPFWEGKRVLDFASGSGLVAIAAAKAGAAEVLAADIDPWARTAVRLNAALNGVDLAFTDDDLIGRSVDFDVVLAGDVFYDSDFARALVEWFVNLAESGCLVLVGDPGRSYRPTAHLDPLATYEVPVTRALEDSEVKKTTVWKFRQ